MQNAKVKQHPGNKTSTGYVYISALTFPVDLTPFQMQKKQITHTARRHRARSHFKEPMSSIPEEMLKTLRL